MAQKRKKKDAHRKSWTLEDIDELVIDMYHGEAMDKTSAWLGRTPAALSSKLMGLRDEGESFVTYGMKRLKEESDKDYEARVQLAKDEVARRRTRLRKVEEEAKKIASPTPEPQTPEAPPDGGGTAIFELYFVVNGVVMSKQRVSPAAWAQTAEDLRA